MRLTCDREILLGALQSVVAAMPSSSVRPVLQNFKLSAAGDMLAVQATDSEVGVTLNIRLGAGIDEEGSCLLPQRLASVLKEATDQEITIDADLSGCSVTGKRLRLELPTSDPAAFADWGRYDDGPHHEIDGAVLAGMIEQCKFSVSKIDNLRFAATAGVSWKMDDKEFCLTTTNGHNASIVTVAANQVDGHKTGLESVASLKFTVMAAALAEGPCKVAFRPNVCWLITERAAVCGTLLAGRFPDVRRIIPKSADATAVVNHGDLHSAVRQAMASAKSDDVDTQRVSFEFGTEAATLRAAGESGKCIVTIPATAPKPFTIMLNPKHIDGILKAVDVESDIAFEFADKPERVIIRGTNSIYLAAGLAGGK